MRKLHIPWNYSALLTPPSPQPKEDSMPRIEDYDAHEACKLRIEGLEGENHDVIASRGRLLAQLSELQRQLRSALDAVSRRESTIADLWARIHAGRKAHEDEVRMLWNIIIRQNQRDLERQRPNVEA